MNRQRPQNDDKILSLFTSGQLVAGLCTLIFYTILIFLIGVVVGRMDPSGKEARLPETKEDVVVSAPEKITAEKPLEKPEVKGEQLSPRPPAPVAEKPAETPAPPEETPAAPERNEKPLQKNTQSHPTLIPNTPAPRLKPPIADKPKPAEPSAAPSEPDPTVEKPAETALATETTEPPAPEKPAEAPPAEPKAEAAPAPAEEKAEPVVIPGNYAVQIAAFTDAQRKDKAAKFLSALHNDKLNAISLPAKNGTVYRLLVVGFKNEADAKARCLQIQQMDKEYAKAYARKLYPDEVYYLKEGTAP